MGWDIRRFEERGSIVQALVCSICTDVMKDPVETPCEHSFCIDCINRWLEGGQKICPVDRKILTVDALKPANRITKQLLENLTVRCKYYGEGCWLKSKFQYMTQLICHELNHCQAVPNKLVFNVRETPQNEVGDLRKKIIELEEIVRDNSKVITEKEKLITDLEKRIKEDERQNTERWKTFHEKVAQLADLTTCNVSLAQRKNELVGPHLDSDRLFRQNTTSGKFYFQIL